MEEDVVQGAVSPEEKPIIENIISLFQKLLSMQEAQAPATEEITEAMTEEENMEEIEKAVTDETGDSTAEERLENVTPTTDLSLQELTKSIRNLNNILIGKNVVKKTQNVQTVKKDQQNQALVQIAGLLKNIVEKQDAQEKLNEKMFEAMGFTDEVVKKALGNEESTIKKNKPIQSLDNVAIIKDVLTEVFKNVPALNQNNEYRHTFNQRKNEDVRKNLRDIATFIHNKGKA